MAKTVVVWFRRDLRLADNPALTAALSSGLPVIPLYIHTPNTEAPWSHGAASHVWLHHSLQALDQDLQALGSRLIIRQCNNIKAIVTLFSDLQAETVHWNRLYDPAVVERDKTLKAKLAEQDIACKSYKAALLFEPWELQTGQGGPYRVFTPMWKNMLKQGIVVKPLAAPKQLPKLNKTLKSDQLSALKLLPQKSQRVNGQHWQDMLVQHWQISAAGAQQRLQDHVDILLQQYKEGRDFPAQDYTSKLSPYLHFGQISPAQVTDFMQQQMVLVAPANATAAEQNGQAYIREIAWREFAHHVLYHYPQLIEEPMQAKFADFTWENNPQALQRWQSGQTGIPIIDAGMRELWQTGWMHNRVRMLVGSLLTKNLRTHWLEGAKWFWDTLLDADLPNNTLGWQWIAGCGADAAPYFRIFNPVTQSEKFDKEGVYIKEYVPELAALPAKYIHAPWEAPAQILNDAGIVLGQDYPEPIIDLKASRQVALDAYQQIK